MTLPHIGVFGAGAIGAYLGIQLSAAGYPVTLLGRERLVAAADKLKAVNLKGKPTRPGDRLTVTADVSQLAACDICLVTVKSGDSKTAGASLASVLPEDIPVISLQNGLGNTGRLREGGLQTAYPGMVTFNVRRKDDATFIKATSGPIMIEGDRTVPWAVALRDGFQACKEPIELRDDMLGIQSAKLLLNLNNGLCALTGLSTRDSLLSGELRWCFSKCIREGLRIMERSELPINRIGRLSPPVIARLILLPTFLFNKLAGSFMQIDPEARSSTLQDLDAGKPTEIDYLNGEIVRLAKLLGTRAPANQFVVDGVHELEASTERPLPFLLPHQVREALLQP